MKTFNRIIGTLAIVAMVLATITLIQNINTGYLTLYFAGETATISPTTINQDDATINYSFNFGSLDSTPAGQYAIIVDPPSNQYSSFDNIASNPSNADNACSYRTSLTPNRFVCCINPLSSNFSFSFTASQNSTSQSRTEQWNSTIYKLSSKCSRYSFDPVTATNILETSNLQLPVQVLSSFPVISSVSIVCSDGSNCSSLSKGSKFGVRVSLLDQGSGSPLTCSISIPNSGLNVSPVNGVVVSNSLQSIDLVSNIGPLPVGEYKVKVECLDSLNYSSDVIESPTFSVGNAVPVISSVLISPSQIFNDSKALTCTAVASDVDNDAVSLSYSWKVGSVEIGKTQKVDCVKEKCLIDSVITCSVAASDGIGSSSKSSDGLKVSSKVKSVSLGLEKIVLQSQSVSFNPVIDYVGSKALNFDWSFGDGLTSKEQKPTHVYVNPGTFTVSLKVDDMAGNSGIGTVSVKVNPAQLSLKILQPIEDSKNFKTTELQITVELKFGENTEAVKQPVDGAIVVAKISNQSIKLVGKGNGLYDGKFKPTWLIQKIVSLEIEAIAKISSTDFKSNAQRTVSFNVVPLEAKIETNPLQPFFEKQKIERITLQLTYPDGTIATELDENNLQARFLGEKEFDLTFEKQGNEFVAKIDYEVSKTDSQNGSIAIKVLKAEDNVGNSFNGGEPKTFTYNVKPPKTELAIELIEPNPSTGEASNLNEVKVKLFYKASSDKFDGEKIDGKINGKAVEFLKKGEFFIASYSLKEGDQNLALEVFGENAAGLEKISSIFVKQKIESSNLNSLILPIGSAIFVILLLVVVFVVRSMSKKPEKLSAKDLARIRLEDRINELKFAVLELAEAVGTKHLSKENRQLLEENGFDLIKVSVGGQLWERYQKGGFGRMGAEQKLQKEHGDTQIKLKEKILEYVEKKQVLEKPKQKTIVTVPQKIVETVAIESKIEPMQEKILENQKIQENKIEDLKQKILESEKIDSIEQSIESKPINAMPLSEKIKPLNQHAIEEKPQPDDIEKIIEQIKKLPKMPWLMVEQDLKSKNYSEETIKEIRKRM